jgi:predicted permease
VPHRYNAAERKEYRARPVSVVPGQTGIDYFLRNRFGRPLYAVFGICAALLLIAAVNLSSLLLARGLRRRQEVAIRLALGTRRSQIVQLFAADNAILVLTGMLLGVFAGLGAARVLLAAGGAMFGNFRLEIGLDGRALAFLIAIVLVVFGCFALASIWQAGRLAKPDGRGVIATQTRAQKVLLGAQIALTLAFVALSTLFAASLRNMYRINFGIDTRNLWDVLLADRPNNFDPSNYYRGLLRQIEEMPGIASASLTDAPPFYGYDVRDPVTLVEKGRIGATVKARKMGASDRFLETLGAKIIAGQDFRRNDTKSSEPTAVVSESLARHFGRPRDLLGRHIRVGTATDYQSMKVIGIASDTDLSLVNLADQKPFTVYLNYWQHRDLEGYPMMLIRTHGAPLPLEAIRQIVKQKGYEYVSRVATISSEIDGALIENRFLAYLSGAFGLLALAMAAVGLFGLLSYQVANRTGEIGIRMALGALRSQIQWLILRQVLQLLVLGIVSGLALTLALARTISSLLFGVTTYDAPLLLLSMMLLTATATVAAWLPVRRASTIDPLQALRHE